MLSRATIIVGVNIGTSESTIETTESGSWMIYIRRNTGSMSDIMIGNMKF